ncbi:FAD dependent oxidoreductase [Hirsutella rhossiliensis]
MSQIQGQDTTAPAATGVSPPTVIVIGAGIIGLTCAIKLQAALAEHPDLRGTEVMVVAREWPDSVAGAASTHSVDYASMWAGAHVRPIPAVSDQLRREAGWLKQTVAEFDRQADAEPWCGITRTTGVEFLDEPDEYYGIRGMSGLQQESGLRGWRTLPPSELPSGVQMGLEYETFCINAPMYCEHLLRKANSVDELVGGQDGDQTAQ